MLSGCTRSIMTRSGCTNGNYDTPWGPPYEIYDKIEAIIEDRDWNIEFNEWFYKEPGMRLAGWIYQMKFYHHLTLDEATARHGSCEDFRFCFPKIVHLDSFY